MKNLQFIIIFFVCVFIIFFLVGFPSINYLMKNYSLGSLFSFTSSTDLDQLEQLEKNPTKLSINGTTFQIEVVKTPQELQRGLSGRAHLVEDTGMLFIFPTKDYHGFWMKDMNFALDFIWIDGDKVMSVSENIQPPSIVPLNTIYPLYPVDKVLEINAGLIKKYDIKKGDRITLH